jgi:protein-disulfide isomerase
MKTTNETKTNYSTPIAIVLAGIIIAGAMYFSDGKKVEELIVPNEVSGKVDIKNVKTEGLPFVGSPTAPVTIAVWSDYQCSACRIAEQKFLAPLVTEYVSGGKVKIVFKDFAFFGPDSTSLALMGRAVWEAYPDKYYEWHKLVYEKQGPTNSGWASEEKLKVITQTVTGINMANINNLLSSNKTKYLEMIEADKAEGIRLGINATPSFIVADQLVVGVPSYDQFKLFLDDLLK